MSDLSRVEQLLRNALGEDIYEVTPQSRVEVLLQELNELIEGMGGSVSPEDIATAVAAYLDEHLTNPTNPPIDTSLTIAGAAADSKETGSRISDLKSGLTSIEQTVQTEIGANSEVQAELVFTDGKTISTSGSNVGAIIDNSTYAVSDPIDVNGATSVQCYYASLNPYGTYFFYDSNDGYLARYSAPSEANKVSITPPDGASYIRISAQASRKANLRLIVTTNVQGAIYTSIGEKLDKNLGSANASKVLKVGTNGDVIASVPDVHLPKYMRSRPIKPLLAEMMSDFAWCSMMTPSAFTSKNVTFTVSGTAGNEYVTVSAISPDTVAMSDVWTDKWIGGVISADGVTFSVCNFKAITTDVTKLSVYPALAEDITNGVLSTLMYDSGESYVGMHLTENGYKAYMQNLYTKNPKHCEVGRCVATFRPDLEDTTTSPFTWYGSSQVTPSAYRFTIKNMKDEWLQRPSKRSYVYRFENGYTAHTTKSGAYWDVNLGGNSGYLEAFVFPIANVIELPAGQEVHVIVTVDGTEALHEVLTNSICKRIIVDYEKAQTGRIEIYSEKWQLVNDAAYGFGIGRCTWWINDVDYPDSVMFPVGAVVAEQFDSWGTFHNGASGMEFERLHNLATGVHVPFTNHSLGSQTSAWGKAWFYQNTWQYHPSICIHDFVINDTNSGRSGSTIPETVAGPDGELYNNHLTTDQYAENMHTLANLAISNGIQPIFMRNTQGAYTNYNKYSNALIDSYLEVIQ